MLACHVPYRNRRVWWLLLGQFVMTSKNITGCDNSTRSRITIKAVLIFRVSSLFVCLIFFFLLCFCAFFLGVNALFNARFSDSLQLNWSIGDKNEFSCWTKTMKTNQGMWSINRLIDWLIEWVNDDPCSAQVCKSLNSPTSSFTAIPTTFAHLFKDKKDQQRHLNISKNDVVLRRNTLQFNFHRTFEEKSQEFLGITDEKVHFPDRHCLLDNTGDINGVMSLFDDNLRHKHVVKGAGDELANEHIIDGDLGRLVGRIDITQIAGVPGVPWFGLADVGWIVVLQKSRKKNCPWQIQI